MTTICQKCKTASQTKTIIAYHGTRTDLPFEEFDISLIGSGLVSTNKQFGGFFFTTEKENAAYYTEHWVAQVKITNVAGSPVESTHPPTVLRQAQHDRAIYLIEDVVDGHLPSDIIVVPEALLEHVEIIRWDFVGDKETTFEGWDQMFDSEEEDLDQYRIDDVLDMMGLDLGYLMTIPLFREYYESKA